MVKKVLLPIMILAGVSLAVWALVVTPEEIQEKRLGSTAPELSRSFAGED